MSPSSSTLPPSAKHTHSRKTSAANVPQQVAASRSQDTRTAEHSDAPDVSPNQGKKNVHYTLIIRLPFPRGDFVDPPPVDWTTQKDQELWKLISSASNSKNLDWEAMSERFEVPLTILLQQAAWLYERHFEGMKAQMKRLGGVASAASKAEIQSAEGESSAGVGMQRKGSSDPKLPPSINTQRSLHFAGDTSGSSPATPRSSKPLLSRNPSTTTVTQSRLNPSSPRQGSLRAFRGSSGSQRRPPPPVQNVESSQEGDEGDEDDESAVDNDGTSESGSDVDHPSALGRSSKVSRRPPFGKKRTVSGGGAESDGDAEDDDEESSGDGYLPFAAAASTKTPGKDDPAATLRGSPKRQIATLNAPTASKGKATRPPPESSESSASSAQPTQSSSAADQPAAGAKRAQRNPLSPQQREKLAQLSPRYKSGSEGSPSLGSSFSDLDELGVTESALEEALMSNMQHGSVGMGSRMSILRDALSRK